MKHRKNCKSCQPQVTCKVKFKCQLPRRSLWMMNHESVVRYVGIELLWQLKMRCSQPELLFQVIVNVKNYLLAVKFFLHFGPENWEEQWNISHPINKHWDMTEFHRWCWPHWMIKCAKRWIHLSYSHFCLNHPSSSLNEFLYEKVGTIPRDNFGKMLVVNTRKELCGAFINKCLSNWC